MEYLSEKKYLNKIICGDALEILKSLPDESLNCCITSPPYWGLRDYGVAEQLGLEKSPEQYVINLVKVFNELKRVLKKDGTFWLNLGDSYIGSWGNYGGKNRGAGRQRKIVNGSSAPNPAYEGLENWRPPTTDAVGMKPKDLAGIPWRVAFALQADGWYLRQDIIWAKPNPMPESVTDRCTKSHEYIFLLTKSPKYFFDSEAIKEKATGFDGRKGTKESSGKKRKNDNTKHGGNGTGFQNHSGYNKLENPYVRNKRSVWTITTKPYEEAHFATFPPDLIDPMIKAGCPKYGIVLDPFMGSGTTAMVARYLGRSFVGIELNPEYIKLAEKRMKQQVLNF